MTDVRTDRSHYRPPCEWPLVRRRPVIACWRQSLHGLLMVARGPGGIGELARRRVCGTHRKVASGLGWVELREEAA